MPFNKYLNLTAPTVPVSCVCHTLAIRDGIPAGKSVTPVEVKDPLSSPQSKNDLLTEKEFVFSAF